MADIPAEQVQELLAKIAATIQNTVTQVGQDLADKAGNEFARW